MPDSIIVTAEGVEGEAGVVEPASEAAEAPEAPEAAKTKGRAKAVAISKAKASRPAKKNPKRS